MEVDALTKRFEKMAIARGGYDEEKAGSLTDVNEEDLDEILRRQFDCLNSESSEGDDDSHGSDWKPLGGESKVSASLPGTERSIHPTLPISPSRRKTSLSWLIPWESTSHSEEKKVDNDVETANGKGTPFTDTDGSVEVQLNIGNADTALISRATRSASVAAQSLVETALRDQEMEACGDPVQTVSKIVSRIDEVTIASNCLQTPQKPTRQHQQSTYAAITRSECCAPFDGTQSPTPFPKNGHTILQSTISRPTEAPAPSPFPLPSSKFAPGHGIQPNQKRDLKAGSGSPGCGFLDLEPNMREMMDIELGKVVAKEDAIKSSVEHLCKRNDPDQTITLSEKPKPPDRGLSKTNGGRQKTIKPTKVTAARTLKPMHRWQSSVDSTKSNTAPRFRQWVYPDEHLGRSGRCMTKPISGLADETKASVKRSVSLPTHRVAAPKPIEICIILDNTNAAMDKFLLPLRLNLERLWDMTSSSSAVAQMSMLTPTGKIDFTRDKLDFLSFLDATCKTKAADRISEQPIVAGLAAAMPHLESLKWTPGSARYVYIFTNLSGWDNDDDMLRCQLRSSLLHLPSDAKTLVARWRSDNEVLEDARDRCGKQFETFAFLNLKEKASFVVHDENLLKGLMASLKSVASTRKQRIKIGKKEQTHSLSEPKGSPKEKVRAITSEARVSRIKPVETIEDVLSRQRPTFHSDVCRMSRNGVISHLNHGEVFSMGKLEFKRGSGKDVMLKSLKLDEINGTRGASSFEYHRNRALVAAVARFFAIQYNKEHRPENCANILFLDGCVIESTPKEGQRHVFYAEDVPSTDGSVLEFNQFCDNKGHWDASVADESLLRFALTCFKLSGGDLMLSGLKGIRKKNVYVLTAPTLLSKTDGDAYTSQCTKEYIKDFREKTRELMERNGWNNKKPVKKRRPEHECKGIFSGLFS